MFLNMTLNSMLLLLLLLSTFVSQFPADILIWSDEFDGAAGSKPDSTKWKHDIGGGGWGNKESEYYTNSTTNAALDGNGNLRITATRDGARQYKCWYGQCEYTSARILTAGLFSHTYGRFEARIRLPYGKGVWPAFWTLGHNISQVPWPQCGEIDILELRGSDPDTVTGAIHGPGYSGANCLSGSYSTPDGHSLSDEFHVFAIDWSKDVITWSVDGNDYQTRTPEDLPSGTDWVFNQNFFVLLNVAIGGHYDGDPDNTTTFPQSMVVDYVRVYNSCRANNSASTHNVTVLLNIVINFISALLQNLLL